MILLTGHIDGQVWRTENRPAGNRGINGKNRQYWTFVVLALIAFMLVLLLNPFTIALSLVAVLLAAVLSVYEAYYLSAHSWY